jgi:AmiR/NasT family two-component response regulator
MGDRALENRVRMSEASGMVTVQAHCSFTEATALMKERARVSHHSLLEIADAVLDRSIRFGMSRG